MKILAFTDVHASITAFKKIKEKIKTNKPDYLLCAGDFTVFEQNIEEVLHKINDLGVKTFLIHGNHEEEVVVKKLCTRYKNITFVHNKITPLEKYVLFCHGGGGFDYEDKDFEKFVKKNKDKLKGKKIIFMTHAPPYQTKLDHIDWMDEHVGCRSYTAFIETFQPVISIHGHIHECFNVKQKTGNTTMYNPGPQGKMIKL